MRVINHFYVTQSILFLSAIPLCIFILNINVLDQMQLAAF